MKLHVRTKWCWVGLALATALPLCAMSCSLNPQSEPPGFCSGSGCEPQGGEQGGRGASSGAGGTLSTGSSPGGAGKGAQAADAGASTATPGADPCGPGGSAADGSTDATDADAGSRPCSTGEDAGSDSAQGGGTSR